ncbi:histidinol-phosphate transaminase [bacterium]|nr:histidinol-phosphate transaminase [bacterium]MBU1754481.1 histidinol-phosphate transaminase [bacterium]
MEWLDGFVEERIKGLQPYEVPDITCRVKLDAHENPYSLPGFVREKIEQACSWLEFNRYPDPHARTLRENLSIKLSVLPEMIMMGNGSDELILYLLLCFGPKRVIFPLPTFAMYDILARITLSTATGIPLNDDFEINDEKIIDEAKKEPSIIFLSYPNNPTGNCFSRKRIEKIISQTDALVVLDEAYYEFSQETFLPLVHECERVVVLRTLSKAFGLAGLRVGYMIAQPQVINEVKKVKLPYNLNAFSQVSASIAIENAPLFLPIVQGIMDEQKRISGELSAICGIKVYPSKANFILFKITEDICAKDVFNLLIDKGILIRYLGDVPDLNNCLRVTVGRPEENNEFLWAMKEIMNKYSGVIRPV